MSVKIFVLFAIFIGFIQIIPNVYGACEANVYASTSPCTGLISIDKPCNESTANFGESTLKSCDSVDLTWAYPMKNLTMTIETPYTQQHQEYAIQFDNKPFYQSTFELYHILNGEEIRINTPDESVTFKSDSNYQIKLKIQAPYSISLYILNFDYKVIKS